MTSRAGRFVGLDFGTTNSSLGVADDRGDVRLARFASPRGDGAPTTTFRSVLLFDPSERETRDGRSAVATFAGPSAIERYLHGAGGGRLIQSLKSYVASSLFQATSVFGRTFTLEELVAVLLRHLRVEAERDLGALPATLVVGRPVRYANSDGDADEALALSRLSRALELAGYPPPVFEFEPVGAAYFYEQSLDHDELVLIGDFGGGTSDFCLVRVGPTARSLPSARRILGTEGVGLAGDAFDARIVDAVVSPRLGAGSTYRTFPENTVLPVPPWIYSRLRRWHHLSFLRSAETLRFLNDLRHQGEDPSAIEALLHLVEYDLGYTLYRHVEGSKVALSSAPRTSLGFRDGPIDLDDPVLRVDFERWISPELHAIDACVDRLLAAASVPPSAVDRVFLTGGSSMVPAVRAIFARRFGEERLRGGQELTSVALGLALRARDLG